MGKVLNVLDMLDRHNFDKVESNNCLDSLYNKIFTVTQNKDGNEVSTQGFKSSFILP
jgi:mediator of RNA polymerase II transcription subunit 12